MRAPYDSIPAPLFPRDMSWVNVAMLRMEQQRGRPILVEFWDCCRRSSLRTAPYLQAWSEKYAEDGLRVIGLHAPGFPPSHDPDVVAAAVERLGLTYAIGLDHELKVWQAYANKGWPARYLWNGELKLVEYHFGEGDYQGTERAVQELLGVERELLAPLRPEDDPEALLVVPTEDREGAWSGAYEAGEVWAVLSGRGEVVVNGEARDVAYDGLHLLVAHERSTEGVLDLQASAGVTCHAVQFAPGLASDEDLAALGAGGS